MVGISTGSMQEQAVTAGLGRGGRRLLLLPYLTTVMLLAFAAEGRAAAGRQVIVPELLEDPQGVYSIDDVTTPPMASRFKTSRDARPNLGYTRATIWLRLPLDVPDGRQPWLLELGYSQLDHVQLFWSLGDGTWKKVETGDRLSFASREVRHRNFLFRVPPGQDRQTAYLRVSTEGPMVLPVTLWRQDVLSDYTSDEQFLLGFYYAFLIALAAYNLFLFVLVRDRAYLFYVGYLGGFALFHASLGGHAFMYLWPGLPAFGNVATVTWVLFTLACGLLFLRRMTDMTELAPRIHRGMGVLALCCLGLIPLTWASFAVGVRIAIGLAVLMVFFLPVPIVSALYHRYRPARFVAIGYAAILPGCALLGLRMIDLLPGTFWIEHAVQFGTALEALLLSFALADRITLLTREKAEAQASLIDAERKALALQQAFSKRLLDVQDNERKRIAAELHDGVGQNLVVLVNKLKRLVKRSAGTDEAADHAQIEEIARGAVHELRDVAHALYPHQLDRLGLKAALRQVIERTLEPADIAYDYDLTIEADLLPKQAEIHVYRIMQEALSNVVRHAEAGRVKITVGQDKEVLSITIDDDGRGLSGEPGFGLAGMEQRARLLGGTLSLERREPRGLTIDLRIPIQVSP